tara:strand:+ start:115 stop:444 length:330 start_codon:yes stop_codon:yes gene_type:complete
MTDLSDRERLIKSMLLQRMGIKGDFDERLEAPVDSQALASKVDQARWIVVVLGILVVAFIGFFLYSFGFESPFLMPTMAVFILGLYAGLAKKELEKRKLIQSLLQQYEN